MKAVFPTMTDRPGNGSVFGIFAYWLFGFVVFPFVLPVMAVGSWDNYTVISWLEIVYHIINFAVAVTMMRSYLAESFFNVRIRKAKFVKTVLLTFAMMITAVIALASVVRFVSGMDTDLLFMLPMSEFDVLIYSDYMTVINPVFGTLCLTVLSPVAISCLFYAGGFATVCNSKPWLAYIVVSLLLLLITGFDILWRGGAENALMQFTFRIPVHLLACWSYQKTDTIWTPIASLALLNLTASLISMTLY